MFLPLECFYKHPSYEHNRRNICKECCNNKWQKKIGDEDRFWIFGKNMDRLIKKYKNRLVDFGGHYVGILVYLLPKKILAVSVHGNCELFDDEETAKLYLINETRRALDAASKYVH